MTWLLSYLAAHVIQISAIGATAYAIAQTEAVVINAETIYKNAK